MRTKISTCFLAALLLAQTASYGCGDSAAPTETTTAPPEQTTTPASVGYPYYDGADLGGKTLTILNVAKRCADMLCMICPEEMDGEIVNDAMYERNAYVMEKLNFSLVEDNRTTTADVSSVFERSMMAQDDTYDAAYIPMNRSYNVLVSGYLLNLRDIQNLHLDESWWDQTFLDATEIGGRSYFASSALHLMGVEGIWCLFFNQDMMDDLSLSYPYELVREGKWTLDELAVYCKTAAVLNGADSFVLSANSTAVYGSTSFYNSINKFILGMGGTFVTRTDDGFEFSAKNEKFINICQKLAGFFENEGYFVLSKDDSTPEISYTTLFRKNRSMFLGAEVKMANTLRDKEELFGIVPFPKLSVDDESYRSTALQQVAVLTIPVTNADPESTALALDALSYESEQRVLPLYFEVRVEQKGLRNENSIEMLQIIRDACTYDIGIQYGWVSGLDASLRDQLVSGDSAVASTIESNRSAIEAQIKDMVEAMDALD